MGNSFAGARPAHRLQSQPRWRKTLLMRWLQALFVTLLISFLSAASGCSTTSPTTVIGSPTPTALTVVSDGHELRVWHKPARAERTRGAMLLLHGRTWSSLPDFDLRVSGEELSLMDGLAKLGFEVYALDARGYGETSRDASGWLTPMRAAADVQATVSWLKQRRGTQPLYLFGWSYGAMVAQLAVQQAPELIGGLILFGYPVRAGSLETPAALRDAPAPPRRPTTAQAAASDFITPGTISQAAIDAFVAQALAADPVRADWRELEQWQALDGAEILVPTLLLEGALDPLAIDEEQARLFTAIPNLDKRWVVLPYGDHAAFMESSRAEFLEAIDAFTSPARARPPTP